MTRTALFVTALSLSLAAGCGNKENGESSAKPSESGGASAPVETVYKPVGSLGIEVKVPADAEVEDNTQGAGFPRATVWATPTTFITGQNDMFWPDDVEAAKQEAQKEANPFKELTKEEVTEGGFHLEYTLESMIDQTPLYGVHIRKTIGGKQFDCSTNSSSEDERARAIAICQSLRAAK